MKMSYYSHANKTHFHKKRFAPNLDLKVRENGVFFDPLSRLQIPVVFGDRGLNQ